MHLGENVIVSKWNNCAFRYTWIGKVIVGLVARIFYLGTFHTAVCSTIGWLLSNPSQESVYHLLASFPQDDVWFAQHA